MRRENKAETHEKEVTIDKKSQLTQDRKTDSRSTLNPKKVKYPNKQTKSLNILY